MPQKLQVACTPKVKLYIYIMIYNVYVLLGVEVV